MKTLFKAGLIALAIAVPFALTRAAEPSQPPTGKAPAYDPWADFMRIQADMQAEMQRQFDAMNAYWNNAAKAGTPTSGAWASMQGSSVTTTEKAYQVQANLAGFQPEDIHVRLQGRLLTISAQTSSKHSVQQDNQTSQSLRDSSFVESLTLPGPVDATSMQETFKDGLLTLSIPRQKS